MATVSPGPANARATRRMRSSAPAPSTTFSGSTPAYSAIARVSTGYSPRGYSFTDASAAATVAGREVGRGSGGTLPSKRTSSTGSTPARRASSTVVGAHTYGWNVAPSGFTAALPQHAP